MVGTLNVTTWQGISIGAVHWYAKLYYEVDNKLETVEITRKMPAKEARERSKQAKEEGYRSTLYRAGEETEGFNTEQEAIQAGIDYFKKHFDGVLYLGEYASCSAWKRVIYWKEPHAALVKEMNEISDKFIAVDGYEGDEKEAEKLDKQWYKRFDMLNKFNE